MTNRAAFRSMVSHLHGTYTERPWQAPQIRLCPRHAYTLALRGAIPSFFMAIGSRHGRFKQWQGQAEGRSAHLHSQCSASKYLPKTSKTMLNFRCEFLVILPENDLGYIHEYVYLYRRVFVFSSMWRKTSSDGLCPVPRDIASLIT